MKRNSVSSKSSEAQQHGNDEDVSTINAALPNKVTMKAVRSYDAATLWKFRKQFIESAVNHDLCNPERYSIHSNTMSDGRQRDDTGAESSGGMKDGSGGTLPFTSQETLFDDLPNGNCETPDVQPRAADLVLRRSTRGMPGS